MAPVKRTRLSLSDKYSVVSDLKNGVKSSVIEKRLNISHSLVSVIKKNQEAIVRDFEAGNQSRRKSKKKCNFETLDKLLLEWFKQASASNTAGLTGLVLQQQAIKLAKAADIPEFDETKIDANWINRFKKRHSIISKIQHGESSSVNPGDVTNWQENQLPEIQRNFAKKDIFNVDECGLMWKALPNRTLAFKEDKCSGGKHSKERITVLIGASSEGEKLPLLVIGKSEMPRAFRGKQLPVQYKFNRRAWMTQEIFTSYIRQLDVKMKSENRKIALIVDNAPSHPKVSDLTNVSLFFLPPNTTACTQPMDAGVIRNLKYHYKLKLVNQKLNAFDLGREFSLDLYEAVIMLHTSWMNDVSPATIRNCFCHTGFQPDLEFQQQSVPCDNIWERMQQLYGDIDFNDYVDMDQEVVTFEVLTDEQLIRDVINPHDTEEDESDTGMEETPRITELQALNAMDVLGRYLRNDHEGAPFLFELSKLKSHIVRRGLAKRRQTTIDSFCQ
jgi:hypothetical protein